MFRLHCRLSPVSVTVSVQSPSPSEFRVRRGLSRVFVAVRVPSSSRSLSARPRSLSQFRRGLSPVLPRCTVCRRPWTLVLQQTFSEDNWSAKIIISTIYLVVIDIWRFHPTNVNYFLSCILRCGGENIERGEDRDL